MTDSKLKFLMRGTRQSNTNKTPLTHVLVRKDSIKRIITEAYNMGKEDAQNEAIK